MTILAQPIRLRRSGQPLPPFVVNVIVGLGLLATGALIAVSPVAAGGVLAVHAEDEDIVMYMYRRLHAEGRIGTEFLHEAHNNLSEDLSFRRVARLAEWTRAAIYLMHVSAKEGVQAIAEQRRKGWPVYGETLHHYATFTHEVYREPEGPLYHTYPSLKFREDGEALWRGPVDEPATCCSAPDR